MIRVNLLPYRNARRHQQILQHLGIALSVIAVAAILSLGAHFVASSNLSELQGEYADLRTQNAILQKKIGKIRNLDALRADVVSKLQLVDRLQEGRFRSLRTFSEVSRIIPENVWVSNIVDSGSSIKITGLGESNKAVANFMRVLDESKIFSNVRLEVIRRAETSGVSIRNFSLTLTRLDGPKKAEGDS